MADEKKITGKTAGYKSTEFWLSTIATLAGIVMASGLVADGSTAATIVGGVLALLGSLGYAGSRTKIKKALAEGKGDVDSDS